jgi:hypothetical protein
MEVNCTEPSSSIGFLGEPKYEEYWIIFWWGQCGSGHSGQIGGKKVKQLIRNTIFYT